MMSDLNLFRVIPVVPTGVLSPGIKWVLLRGRWSRVLARDSITCDVDKVLCVHEANWRYLVESECHLCGPRDRRKSGIVPLLTITRVVGVAYPTVLKPALRITATLTDSIRCFDYPFRMT